MKRILGLEDAENALARAAERYGYASSRYDNDGENDETKKVLGEAWDSLAKAATAYEKARIRNERDERKKSIYR